MNDHDPRALAESGTVRFVLELSSEGDTPDERAANTLAEYRLDVCTDPELHHYREVFYNHDLRSACGHVREIDTAESVLVADLRGRYLAGHTERDLTTGERSWAYDADTPGPSTYAAAWERLVADAETVEPLKGETA